MCIRDRRHAPSHPKKKMSLVDNQWQLLRLLVGATFPDAYVRYDFLDKTDKVTVTMLQDADGDCGGPCTVVRRDETWTEVLPRLQAMQARLRAT